MKKECFAFLLIALVAVAVYAQTTYEIEPESIAAPARCYFDAAGKSDLKALRACFKNDAVIIDVSRTIAGIDAISRWAEAEVFGGRYTILQIVLQEKNTLKLLIRFAPQSYSQGFKAHYTFEFSDGMITKMDLQYA
jgi:hypothetical protein